MHTQTAEKTSQRLSIVHLALTITAAHTNSMLLLSHEYSLYEEWRRYQKRRGQEREREVRTDTTHIHY